MPTPQSPLRSLPLSLIPSSGESYPPFHACPHVDMKWGKKAKSRRSYSESRRRYNTSTALLWRTVTLLVRISLPQVQFLGHNAQIFGGVYSTDHRLIKLQIVRDGCEEHARYLRMTTGFRLPLSAPTLCMLPSRADNLSSL